MSKKPKQKAAEPAAVPQQPLPQYKSHKTVRAAVIVDAEYNAEHDLWTVVLDNGETYPLSATGSPVGTDPIGGFYVVDGEQPAVWLSADDFEGAGFAPHEDAVSEEQPAADPEPSQPTAGNEAVSAKGHLIADREWLKGKVLELQSSQNNEGYQRLDPYQKELVHRQIKSLTETVAVLGERINAA